MSLFDNQTPAIVPMTLEHVPQVLILWDEAEGVILTDTDNAEDLAGYFERNPGLSHVALEQNRVVGAVLCGHDGRRGYLHHLAVAPERRSQGIGRALVDACLSALAEFGIPRCNLFVVADNEHAKQFWERDGWHVWPNLDLMSRDCESAESPPAAAASGEIDAAPAKRELAWLNRQLEEFNVAATRQDDEAPLNLVIRDDVGALLAGLKAITGWDWLYVQILYVREDQRGRGLGTRLLKRAEAEARGRGCRGSCLSSFSFQAPDFYRSHGYQMFGEIPDYPHGHTMHFFSKEF